jgi:hypothetical protein
MTAVPEHDDSLADALALVEAAGNDDSLGFGCVVRNCSSGTVVVLAKLLAELLSDNADGYGVCPGCLRSWAAAAVERP